MLTDPPIAQTRPRFRAFIVVLIDYQSHLSNSKREVVKE
jgi:hypothetical protein